ncbi:MAG: HAMP domain-containing protein [Deltaproteobacteria bacterium]|nr:HAMP domain-containing protein [Deltaproteobacteria bacterium]
MLRKLSFRSRLLFTFWGVLLLALLLPSLYYRQILSADIEADTRANAIGELNSVFWLASREQPFKSTASLQEWCKALGDQLGIRITFVARDGKVIADSKVAFPRVSAMDNHANRPEIIQAYKKELGTSSRYSKTLGRHLIYAARRIDERGVIPSGVIRVAVPFSEVRKRLDHLSKNLILIFVLTFSATIFLSYLLVRQLEIPIQRMIRAAEAIESGDYRERIRRYPGREFSPLAQAINQMAERIELHIKTITGQKQQLEAILNGMSEGVMVLDSNGKIKTTNRALAKIIPSLPASIGRRPLEVIRSHELQQACDQILAGGHAGESQPFKLEISLDMGLIFDVNIVQFRDMEATIGAIVVFHDISELKRLEKVRQDFVANVSHELRTPLTSIKGYAETLLVEGDESSDSNRDFLQIILKHANHMSNMVDDLLQLARLEARQKLPEPAAVDAIAVLNSAWKACGALAKEKEVRLENFLPEEGVQVRADSEQLEQVFRNLLENAMKYGQSGCTVSVLCDVGPEVATFQVLDDGPGIPKQYQLRIFERFFRAEKDRPNSDGSTGLGLAICRHIIQNYGGKIWLESPPPGKTEGSAFYFTLPIVLEES